MNISAGFIRKPVATSLLMLAIAVLGVISYVQLPVASLPNIDSPTIQVSAELPGADARTTASSVATPLERQFGQIPGLTSMTSVSATGYLEITLQFTRARTVSSVAADVQSAINATGGQLPPSLLTAPILRKVNPADTPILLIALTSDTLPIIRVSDYANSILAQKISQVPGVGFVGVGGLQSPSIHVQVNPAQLAAAGLDLETVRAALTNTTVIQPKGELYGRATAFALATNDQIETASGFDDTILAYRGGAPIRVRDVGRAVTAPQDPTQGGWLDEKPAVLLAVQRQPGANVISTVTAIKQALPQLRASLPPGIRLQVVSDRTQTIRASVSDVQFTLMLTVVLVVAVILLFLGKLWATLIPALAIPISILGTFAAMRVLGYSVDNLSLMALTVAVGFVVDDAIVMVENIVRHIDDGATPLRAALDGAGEIAFTIMSISVSLIAVFIPLFLMSGVVGLLFREFAVTVAVSIVVSVFVSLTLTPMMSARLLTPAGRASRLERVVERSFARLVAAYDRVLVRALRHRRVTLAILLSTIAGTIALFIAIPKGFFPQQDTGMILGITEAAEDVSPDVMKQHQQTILAIVRRDPAVASAVGYVGPGGPTVVANDGRLFITLKPEQQRVSAARVITRLAASLRQASGIKTYLQAAQDINIGAMVSKSQYQYTLTDVDSAQLELYGPQLLRKMNALPQLVSVASDQQPGGRTISIDIDRAAASRFGIDPAKVDSTLYDAFGRRSVATIYTSLNLYYLILEADPSMQLGPNALQRIYVLSQFGTEVPLSQIAAFRPVIMPFSITHQGQFPSVTLSFNLAPGAAIGQAVAAIAKAAASLHMPASVDTSFAGNAQAFQTSLSSTPPLILAALFAVYIILGMLYESTIHPLTILSTLPSAGFGALATLMLVGRPLDVIGIIGIILLIGIVKKNGIMLVDFALKAERERGLSSEDAIHEACLLRFRPILMTTMCALLAGIPLMVGTGVGSEIRQPLGYAMVGGLIASQAMTLFTTPVVYLYMDGLRRSLARLRSRPKVLADAD